MKGAVLLEKITIYELAKKLDMTPSMISRALSPNGKVKADKKALIIKEAEKYGFVPNSFASRLSMKNIRIGVIIRTKSKINTEIMLSALKDAFDGIRDYKVEYDVSLVDATNENISDTEKLILSYADFDGLIVSGLSAKKYLPILSAFCEKNKNLVQVQAVNTDLPCLFSSKHDEVLAANTAAEFLDCCLKRCGSKNILLLTGDINSALHKRASDAFESACKSRGLSLVESFDMRDSNELLAQSIDGIFKKLDGKIDGIYTTSGNSSALFEYLYKNSLSPVVVAFDAHSGVREYIRKGVVTATISQDVGGQMKNAFLSLVSYLVKGVAPEKTIYSDIRLVMQSNLHLFDSN